MHLSKDNVFLTYAKYWAGIAILSCKGTIFTIHFSPLVLTFTYLLYINDLKNLPPNNFLYLNSDNNQPPNLVNACWAQRKAQFCASTSDPEVLYPMV